LLAFDLTSHLPAGATIVSVTLQLQMVQTSSGAQTVELHKVQANWGEGASNAGGAGGGGGSDAQANDATWIHTFFPTSTWSKPGGDFSAAVSGATSIDGVGSYTWGSSAGMVADVQSWLDTPASNFGWLFMGNEDTDKTAKAFASRESGAATRPQLTIIYQVPSGAEHFVYLPVMQK
jgi:hypothetical protein